MQERFDTLGAPVFIFSNERKAMYCGFSKMIEVSVAELSGAALNWAVAVATEARDIVFTKDSLTCGYQLADEVCWTNDYRPSSDWSQGGPLIEKYKVLLTPPTETIHRNFGSFDKRNGWYESGSWGSTIFGKERKHRRAALSHPDSPLIVAMRAIVQFEVGDTISVPSELVAVAVAP